MDEADNAGTEGTREDQASYTVVLDSEPTDDVRIDISAPAMVTLSPTSLTFTPSNWNQAQTVTATAVNDSIDNAGNERTGSITHAVVEGDSDYAGVAAESVAVTVNDDDGTPVVTLELDPASIAESGDDNATTVTASLSGASSQDITLTVAAAAVSPALAGDFTLSGTTLTIAAGATESTGTVTVTATDNDVDAANKTVTVSATATGGGVSDPSPVTLTITDDDTRGISVSPVTLTLAEVDDPSTQNTSEHQKTYTVELDSEPTGTVTVNLSSGDTTIATLSDNSLEFTASDWDAQTVTVTAVADNIDNAGDARTVRITHTVSATGTDYKDETAVAVDVTVTDDDGEPTLSIDSPSVAEGDSSTATMTFKVTLSPASGKPVSVAYADATTGTATSATDYAAISPGTLNFAAGQTEKTVDVTVNGDTIDELNETVVLRLSSPSNAALSGGAQTLDGTGTINDDDTPTVSVADATAVNEGDDPDTTVDMSFTVTLSEASSLAVTVPYTLSGTATGGSDYETPSSTSLSIPAGDSSGTIVIKVKGDALDEPNETIIVTLGAPTNATVSTTAGAGTGTGTINDDDGTPSVTLKLSSASITENGGSSTVTASLSGASHQAVTLTVAAAAVDPATSSDFTLSGTTLTIAAGSTTSTGTVTITAVDNRVDAPNKTVTVSATASGGGVTNPGNQTLTINDDDAAPSGITLSVSPAKLGEGDGETEITVTATVNGATRYQDAKTVTLSVGGGTATSGSDYDAVSNFGITIAAAAASQTGTFDLEPTDDTLQEQDETINVTGSSGSLTITSARITIEDNDATGPTGTVSLSASRYEVLEGDSLSVTVKLSEAPATDTAIKLEATSRSGNTATSGVDYGGGVQTVTIRAGTTSGKARISTAGDNLHDPNETFTLAIRASDLPGAVTREAPHTATVTIREPVSGITPPATATVKYAGRNSRFSMPVPAGLRGHGIDVAFYFETRGATARGGADCREDGTDLVVRGVFIDFDPGTARNGPVLRIIEDINTNTIELDVELCQGSVGKTFYAAWDTRNFLGDPDRGYPGVKSAPFNAGAAHCSSTALCLTQVTITGDAPVPDPEITITAGGDIIEGEAAVFTVEASAAPTSNLEVALAIADDDVSDFLPDGDEGSKTVTIVAGSDSATYTLATTDDSLDEANGEVSATLEAGTGYRVGRPSTATVAVEDNDDGKPIEPSTSASLSVSPEKIMEADGDMTITVTATLDGAVRTEATPLTISVDPGTAQADDFAEVEDFPLTIPANATSAKATFVLSPVDDRTNELEETVIVSGTSTIDGFTVTSATVAIRNEDPPASDLSLRVAPGSVREDGGARTVTVTAHFDAGTRDAATDVDVSVAGGTATESDDFAPVSGFTITVLANQVSASRDFIFTPIEDAFIEGSETVRVSATTSVSGLQTHDATLTIEDSTVQSGLEISIDDAEGVEGGFMRYRVHLSEPPLGVVRAKWFTHPASLQTATSSGGDYVHDGGEVVFEPGEQEKFVEVWLIEDGEDDPWETVNVWLLEPQGAVLSDPVMETPHPLNPSRGVGMCCEAEIASGRIFQKQPDPEPVEVTVAAAKTSVAEGGSVRVTATLAKPLRADWSPRIPLVYTNGTAEPEDHNGPALVTIFFSSGKLHGWADIDIAEDADTDDETFTVSFGEMPWQVREGASNSVELTIIDNDGPQSGFDDLRVSIADASANEGREDLEFAVTLNRPAPGPVSVSAFLESGTAERGVDFRGYRGDVEFAAGERLKWMTVIVEDDLIDEGVETMTVELYVARPDEVAIARGVATGRIVNSDPMPKAWLARFGRTVADHSIEAIMQRMDHASRRDGAVSGNHLTIGGRRMGNFAPARSDGDADGERVSGPRPGEPHAGGMEGTEGMAGMAGMTGMTGAPTAPGMWNMGESESIWRSAPPIGSIGATGPYGTSAQPYGSGAQPYGSGIQPYGVGAQPHGVGAQPYGTATQPHGQPGEIRDPRSDSRLGTRVFDMLMGSSFHYSPVQDDESAEPGLLDSWSLWGVTSGTQFSGAHDGMTLQGRVATGTLGFDARLDRLLAGVALSYSGGRGDYGQGGVAGGAVRSTVFGAHPYAHWQWNERTSVWGVLGYGLGQLSLSSEIAGEPLRTELDNAMLAFGGRTVLLTELGSSGGFELALRSDARLTNTASEAIDGLVNAEAATGRVRLLLEGSGNLTLDSGAVLSPTLEAGLRYDRGDAETGKGIEVAAGLGYQLARLQVQVDGRGLLAHDDEAYEEWGWSVSVGYSPDPAGRGLGLKLDVGQGTAQRMGSGLWQDSPSQGYAAVSPLHRGLRSSIELDYGFLSRDETSRWAPGIALELRESGQNLRLGGDYSLSDRGEASISLTRGVSSSALSETAAGNHAAELKFRFAF